MQNLDKIVPEMTDNQHDLTLSQSGEDGSSSTSDSNVKLSHGVNFIQGDIFNVSTMVISYRIVVYERVTVLIYYSLILCLSDISFVYLI
jgi:hypothetical protein